MSVAGLFKKIVAMKKSDSFQISNNLKAKRVAELLKAAIALPQNQEYLKCAILLVEGNDENTKASLRVLKKRLGSENAGELPFYKLLRQ